MKTNTTPINHNILLSRRQIAERWGVSIETVKRREKTGSLRSLRFNQRLVRYRLSDIERFEDDAISK